MNERGIREKEGGGKGVTDITVSQNHLLALALHYLWMLFADVSEQIVDQFSH